MVAVMYADHVKVPVDLTGKAGNISLPAWASLQAELDAGSPERKLLACRILSGELKHHAGSASKVLSSPELLDGLAKVLTCGNGLAEREACSIVRICCYQCDVEAGNAIAGSARLLNALCRLALNEDAFIVETLSQLSHNNPKVLWLITTLLKVLRVQTRCDLRHVRQYFIALRTETALMRTKRQILEATGGTHDLPTFGPALAHHIDLDDEPIDRLCDVEEWVPARDIATTRSMKSVEVPLKATPPPPPMEASLKAAPPPPPPSQTTLIAAPPPPPSHLTESDVWALHAMKTRGVLEEYASLRASAPTRQTQRMCDVDEPAPIQTERMCDVEEPASLKQRMCDVEGPRSGRQTIRDMEIQPYRRERSPNPRTWTVSEVIPGRRAHRWTMGKTIRASDTYNKSLYETWGKPIRASESITNKDLYETWTAPMFSSVQVLHTKPSDELYPVRHVPARHVNDSVRPTPQEPNACPDASVAFRALSVESTVCTDQATLRRQTGRMCDVDNYLPASYTSRSSRATADWFSTVSDDFAGASRPRMPMYSTNPGLLEEPSSGVYSSQMGLYSTNPGLDAERDISSILPGDWCEAVNLRASKAVENEQQWY
eukprot:CAMPEP_0181326838 /NCGR_PEP_ID=MMETSP1101-20121128/21738_1 /TAXON_ID=46948 /ORGANISM="Rhodomonas abbreviata, Strain Caron Lab Isolate" /LENGTH=602 /DNA_ID=CAMNT_0023435371 /DNA_START=63 /DNA_END=1871 /DNA_ORIENTATION=+